MGNSIQHRVAEFIGMFPPFDLLNGGELERVAAAANVEYYAPNEAIFKEGSETTSFFYIVRKGSVRIHHEDAASTLVDLCDEGDLFGVRPLLANEPYLASATTAEETLLYAIPVNVGLEIIQSNPTISLYLARGYASGMPMSRDQLRKRKTRETENVPSEIPDITSPVKRIAVLTCKASDSIYFAAQKMTERNVASIVITNDSGCPIGIMTDSDLRRKVVSKNLNTASEVGSIMSSPVVTVSPSISHSEALILMMTANVHHICVTENGEDDSPVIGIIAERDLMLDQGLHPAVIVKFMRKAATPAELIQLNVSVTDLMEQYRKSQISVQHSCKIHSALTDALVSNAIRLFQKDHGEAPLDYVWVALGSMGRMEQLLKTDQDHALILATDPDEKQRLYFYQLAKFVEDILERWGLSVDVAGILASNEEHSSSLKTWKIRFAEWIKHPIPENILNSSIFFDFRRVAGNIALSKELRQYISTLVDEKSTFFPILASDALNIAPPLSFFRQFVVEKNGDHKDEFDIKRRVMLPYCDIARLLVLYSRNVDVIHTPDRYRRMAKVDNTNSALFEQAARSYEWLIELRWNKGMEQGDDGRYINPERLSKSERQNLREIFATLNDLEQVVRVRFRTDMLRS